MIVFGSLKILKQQNISNHPFNFYTQKKKKKLLPISLFWTMLVLRRFIPGCFWEPSASRQQLMGVTDVRRGWRSCMVLRSSVFFLSLLFFSTPYPHRLFPFFGHFSSAPLCFLVGFLLGFPTLA